MSSSEWISVCDIEAIYPDCGVCALVEEQQIAIFRIGDAVYAIDNHDPASGANVLARGLVGDLNGELVVASPLHKQHFSLTTGRCLEEPELSVAVYPVRVSEAGMVAVQGRPARARPALRRRRLVVIGNGMAAMRTLEELLELAPEAYEITVFAAEPRETYNRILLSGVLAGEARAEEIVTHSSDWFERRGITLHRGDEVVRIDRGTRTVQSRRGVSAAYDRLLIATGSAPVVLPVPGHDLPGVVTFRDLQDVDVMLAAAAPGRRAIVIGGGLLGLEAATGLARQGMQVTVVHLTDVLMERQLDARAGALLRQDLEGRGLHFCLNAQTVAILGTDRVRGVRLADERELPCELVVMATGIRPNITLARSAGLRCDRGILVDDTLLTYDPAIYAVGECVQHRATTYGLVAPLWDQARVCAAYLAERGVRRYGGSRLATHLKVSGIQVFSAGDFSERAGGESLVLHDARRGVYKRLVIEDGRVRGAVLYGETGDGSWYFDLMKEGRRVDHLRDQLLFGPAAEDAATTTQ